MSQRGERGATAVLVAFLMLGLLGVTAVAVDMGALWWDKKQLQNGADAGALAIAQACAKSSDNSTCGDTNLDAELFASSNKLGGDASGTATLTSDSVTVVTNTTRTHWFARFLNIDESDVSARATAKWGAVGGGTTLPLTISECAFDPANLDDPTGFVRLVTKVSGGPKVIEDPCSPTTPNVFPGGFHWLMPDALCEVSTNEDDEAPTSEGNTNPTSCDEDALNSLLHKGPLLIPMYDTTTGTGNNATYHIVGYASFLPTAWALTNKVYFPDKGDGSYRWIEGYFITKVAFDAELDPDATEFGTKTFELTE